MSVPASATPGSTNSAIAEPGMGTSGGSNATSSTPPKEVDLLILGAGWTSRFLIPLLQNERISFAATTTTGRDHTIPFSFDPLDDTKPATSNINTSASSSSTIASYSEEDVAPYRALPSAKTVLITFPLKGVGQSKTLTTLYWKAHAPTTTNWIQLGSTGIYNQNTTGWNDHNSDYDQYSARAIAEDELIALGGVVLNLAGLYGGTRDPRNWVSRVAGTKEALRAKGALHLVHGVDVARAIVGMHRNFAPGDRWIITDRHVYDWWDLVDAWGDELTKAWDAAQNSGNVTGASASKDGENKNQGMEKQQETERPEYRRWVQECMEEGGIRALPRDTQSLGRVVDSMAFWKYIKTLPVMRLLR